MNEAAVFRLTPPAYLPGFNMFMPILPLCQLALGLIVFHLCLASMKLFRHSETALPDYWKMGFLERLLIFIVRRGKALFFQRVRIPPGNFRSDR